MMGTGEYEQPVTMMQRLRLERRKRLMDYQQRLVHAEDWPGFNNLPLQHQHLQACVHSIKASMRHIFAGDAAKLFVPIAHSIT